MDFKMFLPTNREKKIGFQSPKNELQRKLLIKIVAMKVSYRDQTLVQYISNKYSSWNLMVQLD
jgi:hypothetical protein